MLAVLRFDVYGMAFATVLALATLGLIIFEIASAWVVIPSVLVAVVVLSLLLPSSRKMARASLQAGQCPECEGRIRSYEDQRLKYYCPSCEVAFSRKGRRVTEEDAT